MEAGKRLALKELNNNYRFHMTPLIELPPTKFGSFDQDVLRKAVKDIRDCFGVMPRFILIYISCLHLFGGKRLLWYMKQQKI